MNTPQNPPLAIVLIVLAAAFIAGTTLLAKAVGTGELGTPLHALQISQGRFLFAFIILCSMALFIRPKLSRPHLGYHLARSVFGWAGVSLLFAAVAYMPLSDATAISFLNPVFAMILAIPLLGERVGPIRWLAAGMALIGATVLLRPGADTFQPAALIALAAALMMGFEVIFMKRLANREPPMQILLINNLIGLAIASLAMIPFWAMPSTAQWIALAGIGLLMACAQSLFINGMARADASLLVPFTYVTLIFASFYDFAIFGVVPDHISIIGAAIIVSGAALLAFRTIRAKA